LTLSTPYISIKNDTVGISTGKAKSLAAIKSIINQQSQKYTQELTKFGKHAPQVAAIQNAIGWNTTYDALNKRVVSPVSRYWTESFGGPFVLFCWDNYFAAYMAGLFNKDLAYTNAIAITKSITPGGFVPNYNAGEDRASFDRSQPPVGSTIIRELYRKYKEKWVVEYLFDDLLTWNRWWVKRRATRENYLCWGSDSLGDPAANTWQGAAYESGLDNSPMYDKVPFNKQTHKMELADVGLMSLYVMDCESLADLAKLLGRKESGELAERATIVKQSLSNLWDEKSGQYLNYRTDLKAVSTVTSPTNFYPLLTKMPTEQQAKTMVEKHLLNANEYGGEWMLPSAARNTEAFKEQNYWRGRIWGPLNFLCYLGLRNYEVKEARDSLVANSLRLFKNSYDNVADFGIYENYNAITGKGRMKGERLNTSDNYYHWGALLPFISVLDAGYMGNPLTLLK
jgi:neutral trehalase